ncbi:hypothetical protein PIB30_078551 [Stylosanthes scabra]|uniref:Uncharacterized protein n=1 Tax=Stylosanthes scabra TaxID=79078 RepID=A0ABU6TSS6_9FABA|nr:hypothetical protein [Stylosanthes scabra]
MAVNKEIWIEFDLLRDKQGKRPKGILESKKRGKQSYRAKTELQCQIRELTPRRHYPRLGVAEPQGSFALTQRLGQGSGVCTKTSTPRRAPKMPRRDYVKLESNLAS